MAQASAKRLLRGWPVYGITAALALALIAAVVGGEPTAPPEGTPIAMRDLRFTDLTDGAIAVVDAGSGRPVAEVAPASGHFLRATLRGLVRERRRQAYGPEQPFRLAEWPGGRLTLDDLATGRSVELAAFGSANAAAFARLLTPAETSLP